MKESQTKACQEGGGGTARAAKLTLRFERTLERRYERDHETVWRREALITGSIGLVLYDLFLLSDAMIAPALLWRGVVVRLFVFTPCALLCLLMMAWARRRRTRELCKLGMMAISGACALAIIFGFPGPPAVIAQAGLILVTFFGALVLRISFPYAVTTNLFLFAEELVFVHYERSLSAGEIMACTLLVGGCALLSLIANYRLERSERRSYALLLEAEAQGQRLQALNAALEELSGRDGLTGLANRRRFDEYSAKASAEAWRAGLPVSIVMADIDHFKRFNDRFGHLAGDRVLTQVAAAVRSCVRDGSDLAARFGGEEFVIILPGADEAQAMQVAERAVAMVRVEPLRIFGSEVPVKVTLSCGVASAGWKEAVDLNDLIERADRALYEAKRGGRDRVSPKMAEAAVLVAL